MTTLSLRIAKSMSGTDALPAAGGVLATVEPVGGTQPASPSRQRLTVTIPVGVNTPAAVVEVPLGHYLVAAFLPSGDVISREVEVDGPVEISLEGEHSPYEWLSYQHVLGNVMGGPTYLRRDKGKLEARPWVVPLDAPVPPLNAPGNKHVWRLLRDAMESPANLVARLLSPLPGLPLTTQMQDDCVQLFELRPNGPPPPVNASGPVEGRRFLLVEDAEGRATLVSLPFPWQDVLTNEDRSAEVLVQRQGQATKGGHVAVSIRDPLVGTVLGYLTSGASATAQEMLAEQARQGLYLKVDNPVAAAAGAYVLVRSSTELNAYWHPWVDNLAEWFPWLPDGPIIRARLLLQLARDDDDFKAAHEALQVAFARGLPYYGLGLQWLVDGLTVFASEDHTTAEMLEAVRPVARRCNLQQPFTVLELLRR